MAFIQPYEGASTNLNMEFWPILLTVANQEHIGSKT